VDRRFRRQERVRHRRDYDRAYQQGRRVSGRLIRLYSAPNGLPHPRLGSTIGKAVGSAVVRNRLKRWIRETFRLNKEAFGDGFDYVVHVKPEAAAASHEELRGEILGLAETLEVRER
jgi:ribonuclease P protein component